MHEEDKDWGHDSRELQRDPHERDILRFKYALQEKNKGLSTPWY